MLRILVVEDDPAIRTLICDILADDGYETVEAADGMAALAMVRGNAPALVLLDIFMPRMDGEEFLNVSRMIPECTGVPVVVLSASDRVPVDKRVRAFVKKPFDLQLLSSLVGNLLSGSQGPLIA